MLGRHSFVRWALATAAGLAAGAGACATSVQDREHGPEFGDGGDGSPGNDATGDRTGGGGDAAGDAPAAETGMDAPADTGGEGGGDDGAVPGDADAASCPSTMAVLAASGGAVSGALFTSGQWSGASAIGGGGATAAPSILSLGAGGYLATMSRAGNDAIASSVYAGSWPAFTQIGAALAQGTPSLAALGGDAHVVYWGFDGKYYHGVFHANAWDTASDRVGGDEAQSFGSSAPAAAGVGASELLAVQAGSNGKIYDQPWSGGTWSAASAHPDATVVTTISPAVVALSGGSSDAMIVFVHVDDAGAYFLQYTVRGGNGWSAAADVYNVNGNVAYTGFAPSLAALPGGHAVLAWLGANPAYPYYSSYDPQTGWSAPAPIASVALASPPAVAPGVCGADAVAAMATLATGDVQVATLAGGAWSSPATIAGTTGSTWAAIASTP